ncbi:MAG TPA: hypothetical protein VMB48_17810 [Steroidobacteraceae bacterium]|nr:hypothetical protein [Steroidobacteraceae bacterium]
MSPLIAAALLVFAAPGYPGTGADAQPLVDEFAAAAAAAAHWSAGGLSAVYDATESGSLARLAAPDAALAFMPWPFYVQHAADLHLAPLVEADVSPVGTRQHWTLVMKAGAAAAPGLTITSTAGYAPRFVRSAVGAWPLPANVTISASAQVLSALRRAAAGEPVAVLLDQEQAGALPSLPFAAALHAVATSAPVPVALVAVVQGRLPKARAQALRTGLLKLAATPAGAAVLSKLRLNGFVAAQLPPP